MKIKFYLLAAVLAITLFSCSEDSETSIETASRKQVLNFASEKEMQSKIFEIQNFKKNQEAQILERILKRSNLKTPVLSDFNNKKNTISEIDKNVVLEDVKFYHSEKLKALYIERAHFGFTSIQSIADEINYTKIINPEKQKSLINKYNKLIDYTNEVAKTQNYELSLVCNEKGNYLINNKKLSLIEINDTSSINRLTGLTPLKEGILTTNGFYSITYHVGWTSHKDDIGISFYGNFTQYGSFVNGALYPSWYYTNAGSSCNFTKYGTTANKNVPFLVSAGDIVRNVITENNLAGNTPYNLINSNQTNNVSGTYVTALNGQFISLTGNKNLNN